MRQRLAQALALAVDQVNVKAKTAEKMGPVGRGEAIEARAVCLLVRRTDALGRSARPALPAGTPGWAPS